MKTGAKIAIGVGVVAVAAAMIYKMRNGKKIMLPLMPTGNQQPATFLPSTTALPAPVESPVYSKPLPTPIVNRPIDRPIYDLPIYDQEYRGGGRGRIGVDEAYRDVAMAGLSHLLR
jgi:hypothetical protein